jgi:acyl-CoA thioesterase FadM
MFSRSYSVKGEDVNDFMVMQNNAYLKYTTKLIDTFLYVNRFTKLKMNNLKVGLQNNNDKLQQFTPLLFTEQFSVKLQCKLLCNNSKKMNVEIYFYNNKEELCALVSREISWFNYEVWQIETPPKKICNYFTENTLLEAV